MLQVMHLSKVIITFSIVMHIIVKRDPKLIVLAKQNIHHIIQTEQSSKYSLIRFCFVYHPIG